MQCDAKGQVVCRYGHRLYIKKKEKSKSCEENISRRGGTEKKKRTEVDMCHGVLGVTLTGFSCFVGDTKVVWYIVDV